MTLLTVEGVVAAYTDVDILHGVGIRVDAGELVCVIGPNGAGKSTLLKALVGLVGVKAGRVSFAGTDITGAPPHQVAGHGLGYVPQLDNVFGSLTVEENLEMGAFHEPRMVRAGLDRVYDMFDVLAERRRARAATLSGGQRQMLAFGRALMPSPRLLALDEPSAGLAPTVVDEIFDHIQRINRSSVAVLLVEQNARRALALADRGYVLEQGRNHLEGRATDLLDDPKVVQLYLGGR